VRLGEIVTGEVRRPLEIKPAGHGTEVETGVVAGRQEVGGMEAEGTVEL